MPLSSAWGWITSCFGDPLACANTVIPSDPDNHFIGPDSLCGLAGLLEPLNISFNALEQLWQSPHHGNFLLGLPAAWTPSYSDAQTACLCRLGIGMDTH